MRIGDDVAILGATALPAMNDTSGEKYGRILKGKTGDGGTVQCYEHIG